MNKKKSNLKLKSERSKKTGWLNDKEVRASDRERNSLLNKDIEFETAIFNIPVSKNDNNELCKYIAQRYKEKTFDNYEYKEKKEIIMEEIYEIKECATNKAVIDLYDQIEIELHKLVDNFENI